MDLDTVKTKRSPGGVTRITAKREIMVVNVLEAAEALRNARERGLTMRPVIDRVIHMAEELKAFDAGVGWEVEEVEEEEEVDEARYQETFHRDEYWTATLPPPPPLREVDEES